MAERGQRTHAPRRSPRPSVISVQRYCVRHVGPYAPKGASPSWRRRQFSVLDRYTFDTHYTRFVAVPVQATATSVRQVDQRVLAWCCWRLTSLPHDRI
jgi:hypothetical protein